MIIVRRRRALSAVLPLVKRTERERGWQQQEEKRLPVGREIAIEEAVQSLLPYFIRPAVIKIDPSHPSPLPRLSSALRHCLHCRPQLSRGNELARSSACHVRRESVPSAISNDRNDRETGETRSIVYARERLEIDTADARREFSPLSGCGFLSFRMKALLHSALTPYV